GAAANTGGSTLGTLPNPTNHGYLTTDGSVSLTSGLKFEIDGAGLAFLPNQPYSYQIGQLNGWAGGQQAFTDPNSFSTIGFAATGMSAEINAGGSLFVNFTPIPEPTWLLVLAGAAALAADRRRRRV